MAPNKFVILIYEKCVWRQFKMCLIHLNILWIALKIKKN